MEVQQGSQQKLQQHIGRQWYGDRKFQEMSIAYNQSPKVKEKIDAKMEELEDQKIRQFSFYISKS